MLKKIKTIFVFVFGFLVVLFLAGYGYQKYSDWEFDRETERLKQELERPYLEDTYGGKTPKETLEMFIAAVEKEDFDLASKYFVLSKQEEWREGLIEAHKEKKLNILMEEVRQANKELEKAKPLWETQDDYFFDTETNVALDFVKYPKDIWKIQEI